MMTYQKILVPLDGSKPSECILDHVRIVAKGCSVPKIVLLRVVEPFSPSAVSVIGEAEARTIQQKERRTAEEYLSYVAAGLRSYCGGVEQVVVEGKAADAILDFARAHAVDLIAMATHGESGAMRWAVGSVTQRVQQHSPVPMLTVTPAGCRP